MYVVDALKRWEPQVHVRSMQTTREENRGQNVLAIRLRYSIVTKDALPVGGVVFEQTVVVAPAPPAAGPSVPGAELTSPSVGG